MRTASSMTDCIMRTANMWERQGAPEGAELLRKVAQPGDDVVSQIEKALTGRRGPIAIQCSGPTPKPRVER